MKKSKCFFASIIATLVLCANVVHASDNFTVSASEVYVGDSFTVSLTPSEAAAWNVHIDSAGPVKDCNLAAADVTEDAKNTTKNFSVNCKAVGAGEISVTLSGDYTSEDGVTKDLSGSTSISVKKQGDDNDSDKDDDSSKDNEKQEEEVGKEESDGKDEGEGKDGTGKNDIIPDVAETSGIEDGEYGDATGTGNTGFFTAENSFAVGSIGAILAVAVLGAVLVFRRKKQSER